MPKSFSFWPPHDLGSRIRLGAVVLAVANLVALYFILFPLGGSPAELRQRADDLTVSLQQRRGSVERTQKLVEKIEAGRAEGDDFLEDYFLPRRTASSEILTELTKCAAAANVKAKENSMTTEPVEGSDTLSMMQIAANFEGTYTDLVRFINQLDKSDKLLIVEGLNATPQQGSQLLSVVLKLDTFVREDEAQ